MSRRQAGLALAVSTVLAVVVVGLSQLPYTPDRSQDAVIRLAWRYRGEAEETCRAVSPEERARLPLHMRRDTVCVGGVPPYRLVVALDGRDVEDAAVTAAGARHDRPIFVFRELRVPPGSHRLEVTFAPERSGPSPASVLDARSSPPSGDASSAVDGLALAATVTLEAREIALVTYDEARAALVVRSP